MIRNVLIRNKLVLRNHFWWPIVNLLHRDKENLALRNNFRVTNKFLITKFDCINIRICRTILPNNFDRLFTWTLTIQFGSNDRTVFAELNWVLFYLTSFIIFRSSLLWFLIFEACSKAETIYLCFFCCTKHKHLIFWHHNRLNFSYNIHYRAVARSERRGGGT